MWIIVEDKIIDIKRINEQTVTGEVRVRGSFGEYLIEEIVSNKANKL